MAPAEAQHRQQARLWSAAFGVSALINVMVVLLIVVWASFSASITALLLKAGFDPASFAAVPPPPPRPAESVAMIVPVSAPVRPPSAAPFVRTSKDQESARPERPAFIGDRNTTATSDAPSAAQAPEMPGQQGRAAHHEDESETTVSKYQEGELFHDTIAPTPPAEAVPAPEQMAARPAPEAAASRPNSDPAPAKEALASGPLPVARQVKDETPPEPPKPPAPEPQESPGTASTPEPPQPAPPAKTPGFRGNQQKTQLSGSITRQGRSALDVEDSPLGRYHASLSRAVQQEWELACVRNEKYLTSGQIIVRFVLEPSGKVRSLTFVEEFGVGNIQKGFTLESIRTAAIPPFPAELKKQRGGEPLEVTYSFTF